MAPTPALTSSLEDYLEAVLELSGPGGARTTDVAAKLGVSKASANQAIGVLVDRGLASREPYGPIFLTDEGKIVAQAVYKRHKTIKRFLISVLGVDEDTAEEDACRIEHVVSNNTVQHIIAFMERSGAR